MKKFSILSVVLLTFGSLTACSGYESLSTPFSHRGQGGVNLFGADAQPDASGAYEIVVNAAPNTSQEEALQLFGAEARRICGNSEYKQVITSQGTAKIRQYGVKGIVGDEEAPTVRGYVTCVAGNNAVAQ